MSETDKANVSDGYHTFKRLYRERSALAGALARTLIDATGDRWAAYTARDPQDGVDGYRTVLYINLPTGQVSWHFSDDDCDLLAGVPNIGSTADWDGHDTAEKYRRVEAYAARPAEPMINEKDPDMNAMVTVRAVDGRPLPRYAKQENPA